MTHQLLNKSKLIILATALILMTWLGSGTVQAQELPDKQITASPAKIKLDLKTGQIADASFEIINSGKKELQFKVYAKPYTIINSKYDYSNEKEESYNQINRWIKFDQTKYKLGSGQRQKVNFKVYTPQDIPDGSQYAMIMAETINDENDELEKGKVKTVRRLGIRIEAKTDGQTRLSGSLTKIKIPLIQTKADLSVKFNVKNDGNVDFDNHSIVKVKDIFGNDKFTKESIHTILPDTTRDIIAEWDKAPALGLFKLEITNQFLDQTKTHHQFLLFLSPIITIILIVLITILAIGIVYIIKNKRRA